VSTRQSAFVIDACTLAQAPEVRSLALLAGLSVTPDFPLAPYHELWTATCVGVSESVIGFLSARRVADELEILDLAVHPNARRRGAGSALLLHTLDAGRLSGVRATFLEVASKNQPAVQLYAQHGFRTLDVRRRYYPSGDDALVMIFSFDGAPSPV
jgi:ribosomal-protein-alanine N-acetyltransferase